MSCEGTAIGAPLAGFRMLCGDSMNPEHVALLMDGALADMLLTDPPYNVDYKGKTKDELTMTG